ncbi:dTMP kinase [Paenibacillus bovis]|uniref:Thymidylate kinase n=1 Tax=Paenibacillus bovis TaxID=1616788 RepID=A0A172ZBR8_9BACL|nr:dTMP kinase [Paenibacillus bovis]ANF95094.1 dTMP kinase [Paenibacillus bovis]
MKQNGLFIAIEGMDGSGKTSQLERIKQYLTEKKVSFLSTREPGGIPVSEQIRNVILNVDNHMSGLTECLLYASARREHLIQKVIPAVQSGQLVICDRYVMSSLAYQGYGRELGQAVLDINRLAIQVDQREYWADVNIYINVRPEVGLERIMAKTSDREINRLDLEAIDFHHRVYEGYTKLSTQYAEQFIIINGEQSEEEVFEEIRHVLEKLLAVQPEQASELE